MDNPQQRIFRAYEYFRRVGVIDADDTDELDIESIQSILRLQVDAFETDIHDAYATSPSHKTSNLTKAALLGMVINGEPDEQLKQFLMDKKLSSRMPLDTRVNEALGLVPKMRAKAIKARTHVDKSSELRVDEQQYRSLDDTLSTILTRNGMSATEQGSMRLLFGFAALTPDQAQLEVVTQLKANAAGIVRHQLIRSSKALEVSPRTKEGERLLHRVLTRSRTGYPTVQALAEIIAHDTDTQSKAVYTDNVDQNQRLMETYMSEAFDVLYPSEPIEK